jgi:hypothetical protein
MTLEEAIEEFKKLFAWLEDPKEADGKCGAKSYTFIQFLKQNGVPEAALAKDLDYTACTARHHPLKPEILTRKQDRYIEDYAHRGIGQWCGHTVVKIGRLRIDWTARQYDPEAPFPLIWRTKT